MAEKLIAKMRVKKIEMANPLEEYADIATATWEELPLTLRDDELRIFEEEPEEDELYSHENDAPEDTDVVGTGLRATGTFIKVSRSEMATLMGGDTEGTGDNVKFVLGATKLVLKKALRFTMQDDSVVVAPHASGHVNMDLNLGKGGRAAFPFNFRLLKASADWDAVIVM